jgi:hypothetical protein
VIDDEYINSRFQIGIEKLINETGLDAKLGVADYKLAYLLCEIIGANLAAMHTFDSYKRGTFIGLPNTSISSQPPNTSIDGKDQP